ncbi:hypothetical protein HYG86_15385 [Alkalicella caledoniensis]|uniref:FMN-binding domain-containing protein n=1 Tax=Alkalicella caledoniensis TaxID=2731377 RepID=A0A7G9WBJ0_ALKCA|nr:hypothetical protein [Alkalicella caledoniensis]QNO16052.1 hypothetical protein HYG86_15385 [Alkalicella caledoniensis]
MKKTLWIIIGVVAAIALAVFFLNRTPDTTPDPTPQPDEQEQADEAQQEYDPFEGNVWLNAEGVEMENTPILDKGAIHLPLLELANALNIEVSYDSNTQSIWIGTDQDEDIQESEEELKIYKNNADLTPSNIITLNDEFYISGREIAPLLDIYFYESLFENAVFLVDDSEAPRDGEYVAVRRRDQRGWEPRVNITIENGQITSAEYNEYNQEDQGKLDDPQYIQNWQNTYPDVDPLALVAQLEEQLVSTQSVSEIDVTTGATGSYRNFTELASIIMAQSRVSKIGQEYVDGDYEVYGNPAQNGWTPYITYQISNGTITSFTYDEVNEEGNSKREDEEYINRWRGNFEDVDPIAIIEERERQVLLTQDPNTVDVTTGATSWGRNMKRLTTGSILQAQQSELEQDYETIYVFVGEQGERGDLPQLLITTDNDEMTNVNFSDYRNGVNKKFDEPYLQRWSENYPDVDQLAIVQEMEETFLESQDPDELDAITGATNWRNAFQTLARRALEVIGGAN